MHIATSRCGGNALENMRVYAPKSCERNGIITNFRCTSTLEAFLREHACGGTPLGSPAACGEHGEGRILIAAVTMGVWPILRKGSPWPLLRPCQPPLGSPNAAAVGTGHPDGACSHGRCSSFHTREARCPFLETLRATTFSLKQPDADRSHE